jgi:uncharacterized membrane protein YkgB
MRDIQNEARRERGGGQPLRAAIVRAGLIAVIAFISVAKAWPAEAQAIQPLVSNSPLLSWVYGIFSVRAFSALLGAVELTIAFLLALSAWSPRATMVGSVGAMLMFATTLSFLFTTPGIWDPSGPPVLSLVGGVLFKDLVLLGVASWSFLEAREGVRQRAAGRMPVAARRPAYP